MLLEKIIFLGGLVVIAFGALQVLLLPPDFLRHFGYSAATIQPYLTVDNNEDLVRILSTLRGPNVLAAYLVLWLPLLAAVSMRVWKQTGWWRAWLVLVWGASIITLLGTRSRSGFIGVVVALGLFVFLTVPRTLQKKLAVAGVATLMVLSSLVVVFWNTTFVQITVLHRDPAESSMVDSDDQRLGSLQLAVQDIANSPLGQGVGSTGLASTYGNNPKITENYFLQIGQELGVLGLGLFVAINYMVGILLWRNRANAIARGLLASLIGLSVIGLFLPVWGDETVSMIWWGAAGVWAFIATKNTKRAKL